MGVVLDGEARKSGRRVAIKLMQLSGDADARARFARLEKFSDSHSSSSSSIVDRPVSFCLSRSCFSASTRA